MSTYYILIPWCISFLLGKTTDTATKLYYSKDTKFWEPIEDFEINDGIATFKAAKGEKISRLLWTVCTLATKSLCYLT